MSDESPTAVDVKERSVGSDWMVDAGLAPEAARSGVLKYAYSGTVNDSM